jgi:hypothetical protein
MGWLSDLWKYGITPEQRVRSHAAEHHVQAIGAYERELATLSAAEARTAAERVLVAPRFVRATPWDDSPPHPELAPALREFFRRFRTVEVAEGEQCADIAELAPLEWAPGYLRLGTDGEHTHLAVRPGDECIYVLADDVGHEERVDATFATVYHWILWLERNEELLAAPDPPAA